MTHRERRSYDHRVKAQIIAAFDDPHLLPELEVQRATALSWIRRGLGQVVTLDDNCEAEAQLRDRFASSSLRVLGLSAARYHDWGGSQANCLLDDRSSCPRSKSEILTHAEVETIGDIVQSKEYRHLSIRGLALHAQRIGKVFAHKANTSPKRTMSLFNQSLYWYSCLPNMRDDWFERLMTAYEKIVREHKFLGEILEFEPPLS